MTSIGVRMGFSVGSAIVAMAEEVDRGGWGVYPTRTE